MFLRHEWVLCGFLVTSFFGCSSPPPPKKQTIAELIRVDTETTKEIKTELEKRIQYFNRPKIESFLTKMASRLLGANKGEHLTSVSVKVHVDKNSEYAHGFALPGTTIFVPLSFLKKVQYENELAAFMAFELAQILKRTLATRIEAEMKDKPVGWRANVIGENNVFQLTQTERKRIIQTAAELVYYAGYDLRGMPSIFSRYSEYYLNLNSEIAQDEVEFNLREAQRARSELLPTLDPVVRSAEFIQFKRDLGSLE